MTDAKALIIDVEGLYKSGKSTLLKAYLSSNRMVEEYELKLAPRTHSPITKLIKSFRQDPVENKEVLALLFAALHLEQFNKFVQPYLDTKTIFFFDRYVFSSMAEFGSMGLDDNFFYEIESKVTWPDLMVFVDTSPETCVRRAIENGKYYTLTRDLDLMSAVRNKYLEICSKTNSVIINGNLAETESYTDFESKINNELRRIIIEK